MPRPQGYSEPELRSALDEFDDSEEPYSFLDSVASELINTPSSIKALVFLVNMSVRDLIELNKKIQGTYVDGNRIYDAMSRPNVGLIVLGKDVMAGFYNSWDGGGGPFEIIFERDIELPIRFIHSALPDGEEGRWSIRETYGMCESAWTDSVTFKNQ